MQSPLSSCIHHAYAQSSRSGAQSSARAPRPDPRASGVTLPGPSQSQLQGLSPAQAAARCLLQGYGRNPSTAQKLNHQPCDNSNPFSHKPAPWTAQYLLGSEQTFPVCKGTKLDHPHDLTAPCPSGVKWGISTKAQFPPVMAAAKVGDGAQGSAATDGAPAPSAPSSLPLPLHSLSPKETHLNSFN